jgi:predicted lipid-binding transport protein (Tim44 family)
MRKGVQFSNGGNIVAMDDHFSSSSPIDVLADTDAEGEVSAMQLLYSGELEAWNQKKMAAQARSKASGSIISGIAGGLSTGLLGASKLGLLGGTTQGTTLAQLNKSALGSVWGKGLKI